MEPHIDPPTASCSSLAIAECAEALWMLFCSTPANLADFTLRLDTPQTAFSPEGISTVPSDSIKGNIPNDLGKKSEQARFLNGATAVSRKAAFEADGRSLSEESSISNQV